MPASLGPKAQRLTVGDSDYPGFRAPGIPTSGVLLASPAAVLTATRCTLALHGVPLYSTTTRVPRAWGNTAHVSSRMGSLADLRLLSRGILRGLSTECKNTEPRLGRRQDDKTGCSTRYEPKTRT